MHLHGHDMWVLHEGPGQWDGTIINSNNPQRRDTQNLIPYGHMVLQYNTDNPGIWLFHCHIAWHVSTVSRLIPLSSPCSVLRGTRLTHFQGLSVTFMERPADINQMQIPYVMEQTCADWNTYSENNIVDQIDSGI